MKYTIIIPIYNSEKTLSRCLDSIINQTYNNLEIILIDDGSTDSSYLLCKKYQKKDNRIIILRNKANKGQSSARNKGIKNISGDYFTFIDSDDYIPSDYFEKINNINKDNYDFIRVGILKDNTNIYKDSPLGVFYNDKELIKSLLENEFYTFAGIISNKFKEVRFKEDIILFEDKLYYTELLNLVNSICLSDITNYIYLDNPYGITNDINIFKKKYESAIKVYSYCVNIINIDYSFYMNHILYFFYNYVKEMDYKEFYNCILEICNDKYFISFIESNDYNVNLLKRLVIKFIKIKFYYGIFIIYKLKRLLHI